MHSIKREDLLKAFAPAKELENKPIKDAVGQIKSYIYNDFTFRTEKGIKKEDIKPSIDKTVEDVRDYILQTPNEENQDSFDKKHEKWCREFIEDCNFIVTVGKAQKVINMAFKYFYCCQDAVKNENAFKHCHMPLDSYTLDWVKTISKSDICKKDQAWSKLDEKAYIRIQKHIREHLKENETYSKLSPFLAEFYIWPEEQWRRAYTSISKILKEGKFPTHASDELDKQAKIIIEAGEKIEHILEK